MLILVFRKVTGSAVRNVTSDVGSDSALLPLLLLAFADRVSVPHELVWLLGCRLACRLLGTEVLVQVIQKIDAIGVGDHGTEAFHFVEFGGPSLAGEVLFGDAAGVVARSAGRLHLCLSRAGRKWFAGSTGRLRARQNDGC